MRGEDMRRPSRIRRWFKWGGLVLSLLITVVWAVSLFVNVKLFCNQWSAYIYMGGVSVEWDNYPNRGIWVDVGPIGAMRTMGLLIPLILPFILASAPTAYLFWRDRRHIPQGHCQKCGYNLTGNTSGICPECGEKI
jgi:hypothetical protein